MTKWCSFSRRPPGTPKNKELKELHGRRDLEKKRKADPTTASTQMAGGAKGNGSRYLEVAPITVSRTHADPVPRTDPMPATDPLKNTWYTSMHQGCERLIIIWTAWQSPWQNQTPTIRTFMAESDGGRQVANGSNDGDDGVTS